MVWGAFDRWLVAVVPAKELRAEVRRKGVAGVPPTDKGQVLKMAIELRLSGAATARQRLAVLASGGPRLANEAEEECAVRELGEEPEDAVVDRSAGLGHGAPLSGIVRVICGVNQVRDLGGLGHE